MVSDDTENTGVDLGSGKGRAHLCMQTNNMLVGKFTTVSTVATV